MLPFGYAQDKNFLRKFLSRWSGLNRRPTPSLTPSFLPLNGIIEGLDCIFIRPVLRD